MNKELLASTIQSFGLPDFLVNVFATHPYGILFLSLIVGGGIILFPAFYLSVLEVLNPLGIIGIMVLATCFADSFWYVTGRGIMPKFIESRLDKGRYAKKFAAITEGRELLFLFYSKFIYGTRIATQLMCGARKVNFPAYLFVNAVAVALLGLLYYGAIKFTAASVDSLGDLKYKLVIVLTVTMVMIGTLHFIIHRVFKKKFYVEE